MSGCRRAWLSLFPLLLTVLTGCAGSSQARIDDALRTAPGRHVRNEGLNEFYQVQHPDVLEVSVKGRTEKPVRVTVDVEGRIFLGERERVRVAGLTAPQIRQTLAQALKVPEADLELKVHDYLSQQVYLCGAGNGVQRAIAYQGPETVLDLLQRAGGIQPGAAPRNVQVVRSRLLEDKQPEVIQVDLEAILLKKELSSNVRVQAFDQIHIGETKPAKLVTCLPRWVRPSYEWAVGLWRPGEKRTPRAGE